MRGQLVLLLLASFPLACGKGLPELLADCVDATCRSDWVIAAFGRSAAEGAAAIDQLPDTLERVAVVSRLVEVYPGKTLGLCDKLTRGPPRERCMRINTRPHLWSEPPAANEGLGRAGGGPAGVHLPVLSTENAHFASVQPLAGPCTHRKDQAACYTGQAVREVRRGAASRGAAACAAIETEKWKDECLFSAAEALIEARSADGLYDASELCLVAGDYAPNCMGHLIELLARTAPDASVTDPMAWDPLHRAGLVLHEVWAGRDGRLADLYTSRLWSEATRLAYAWTPKVTGAPLDVLPKDAVPQIRAAAAARLVQLDGLTGHPNLAAWVDALKVALASRPDAPFQRPQKDLPHDREIFWAVDGPDDEAIPAVFYLGTARRTISEDPDADLAICVLEGVARAGMTVDAAPSAEGRAAALALLDEGTRSRVEAVRWTATRLRNRPPVAMW